VARMILGQAADATSETTIYTVPSGKMATVSSLTICNRGLTEISFRISCSVAGASTSTKDYLYYDLPVSGRDTFIATIGATLAATDVIRVFASAAGLSFNAFGDESDVGD